MNSRRSSNMVTVACEERSTAQKEWFTSTRLLLHNVFEREEQSSQKIVLAWCWGTLYRLDAIFTQGHLVEEWSQMCSISYPPNFTLLICDHYTALSQLLRLVTTFYYAESSVLGRSQLRTQDRTNNCEANSMTRGSRRPQRSTHGCHSGSNRRIDSHGPGVVEQGID